MRHKLLVAVDGTEVTWKTAAYVGAACAGEPAPGTAVVLLHVLPALPPFIEAGDSNQSGDLRERFEAVAADAAKQMLAKVREQLCQQGVRPECVVEETVDNEGHVAVPISEAARRHQCDTIVVGRRSKSMIGEFFRGSVVEHLLRKPIGLTIWVIE